MKRALLFFLMLTLCLFSAACAAGSGGETHNPPTPTREHTEMPPESGIPMSEAPQPSPDGSAEFFRRTRDYLLSGQSDLPSAEQLHWSPSFLEKTDFEANYRAYLDTGGEKDDVISYADYLTENAPAPDNWKELFEKDLLEAYDVTPARYEDLGGGIYQVYVERGGSDIAYVTVNSRTGWYHG